MKRYEYYQEMTESISDDNWLMLLEKHGSQGWELSSVILQDTYKIKSDKNAEVKQLDGNKEMQTIYLVVFKREY